MKKQYSMKAIQEPFESIPNLTDEERERVKQEALHMIYEALKHRLKRKMTCHK